MNGEQLQKDRRVLRKMGTGEGTKGNRNFRSHVLSLPEAKVPPMELSLPGTFAPWYFRSVEL